MKSIIAYLLFILLLVSCSDSPQKQQSDHSLFPHQDVDSVQFITIDTMFLHSRKFDEISANPRFLLIDSANHFTTGNIFIQRLSLEAIGELQKLMIPITEPYTLDCISESLNAFAFYHKGKIISSVNIVFPCEHSFVNHPEIHNLGFGKKPGYEDLVDFLNKYHFVFSQTKHVEGMKFAVPLEKDIN